jgi:hypothetical protein
MSRIRRCRLNWTMPFLGLFGVVMDGHAVDVSARVDRSRRRYSVRRGAPTCAGTSSRQPGSRACSAAKGRRFESLRRCSTQAFHFGRRDENPYTYIHLPHERRDNATVKRRSDPKSGYRCISRHFSTTQEQWATCGSLAPLQSPARHEVLVARRDALRLGFDTPRSAPVPASCSFPP